MTDEEFFDEVISDLFRRCNTCFKMIDKKEPYIVAYKNGYPAYFCRDHIHDAEHYLDWFQELVDIRRYDYDTDSRD